jgi:hypothetical protein
MAADYPTNDKCSLMVVVFVDPTMTILCRGLGRDTKKRHWVLQWDHQVRESVEMI